MRALVTGGAGFIGSHIVDLFVSEGHDVFVADNFATGKPTNLNRDARFVEADISSPDFERVIANVRPEVVLHQAAQPAVKPSTDRPLYDAQINVIGLVNVLEACSKYGVRKIVFASSGATYGNPDYLPIDENHPQRPESPYGITKMVAEHYLRYYARDRSLAFTALRYGNVYGPRQDSHGEAGVVAIFARQLLTRQTPTIHWDGEQVRDYVYVADVARANLLAATAGDGRCYCIGTGEGTTVNRLLQMLYEAVGVVIPPRRAPRRPGDLRAAFFDPSRARNDLGWEARTPLVEGIRNTVAFCRSEQTSDLLAIVAG